ncbi:MAG TPA: hypothetical protein VKS01_12310 [Bryobacteraceae bacterium]|nr:hypothetical protein [Bryobacteraceae bacterium]
MALFFLLLVFFICIVAIVLFAFPPHRIVELLYKQDKTPGDQGTRGSADNLPNKS